MPTVIHCPHCLHPVLVPARSRGKGRLCRQCGGGYLVARGQMRVRRLAAASTGELLKLAVRESRITDLRG
jgi:DNA-directed RNA polymerase subunit RPC12/RpoP